VLFDFDGTLANTLADGLEILNELSGEFGFRRLEGEEIDQARDMTTRQVMRFLNVPSRKLPTIAHRGIKRLRSRMDRIQPFAEVPDMLKELTAMGLRRVFGFVPHPMRLP
jgi:phosphoglycolate phosphatase